MNNNKTKLPKGFPPIPTGWVYMGVFHSILGSLEINCRLYDRATDKDWDVERKYLMTKMGHKPNYKDAWFFIVTEAEAKRLSTLFEPIFPTLL